MAKITDDDFPDNFDSTVPSQTTLDELIDGTVVTFNRRDKIVLVPSEGDKVRLIVLRIDVTDVQFVTVTFIRETPDGTYHSEQNIPVSEDETDTAVMQIPDEGYTDVTKIIIRFRPKRGVPTFTVSNLYVVVCMEKRMYLFEK